MARSSEFTLDSCDGRHGESWWRCSELEVRSMREEVTRVQQLQQQITTSQMGEKYRSKRGEIERDG